MDTVETSMLLDTSLRILNGPECSTTTCQNYVLSIATRRLVLESLMAKDQHFEAKCTIYSKLRKLSPSRSLCLGSSIRHISLLPLPNNIIGCLVKPCIRGFSGLRICRRESTRPLWMRLGFQKPKGLSLSGSMVMRIWTLILILKISILKMKKDKI